MAITITWGTKVINVPKADTQLVQATPTEIRQLDLDTFRLTLKDLEDDVEGMAFPHTHEHVAPITVGGVTLARVIEIVNGYTVTFEDGQYAVNLTGANSNVGDVINVNQVSVRSANSAGLTYSKQIEDSAFGDERVWIDTVGGLSGTGYPRGTTSDPVDNLADAQSIIASRNLPKRLHLNGTIVVGASDNISNYDIKGSSPNLATMDVTTGATTTNLVIEQLGMTGDLNGNITALEAVSFANLVDFDGSMVRCGLSGTIQLGSAGDHNFIDCVSEVAGTSTPVIDCDNIAALFLSLRRYSGGIELQNLSDAGSAVSVDLTSGHVVLDSTCTNGVIVVRGAGHITDNSGPNCTVVTTGLVDAAKLTNTNELLNADETYTSDTATKYRAGTTDVLVQKTVMGGENLTQDISLTE